MLLTAFTILYIVVFFFLLGGNGMMGI